MDPLLITLIIGVVAQLVTNLFILIRKIRKSSCFVQMNEEKDDKSSGGKN